MRPNSYASRKDDRQQMEVKKNKKIYLGTNVKMATEPSQVNGTRKILMMFTEEESFY